MLRIHVLALQVGSCIAVVDLTTPGPKTRFVSGSGAWADVIHSVPNDQGAQSLVGRIGHQLIARRSSS